MKTKPQKKLSKEISNAIERYVYAWQRGDWSTMSFYASIKWQRTVEVPSRSLKALYEHIKITAFTVDLRHAVVPKGCDETGAFYDVPVNIKMSLGNADPQWRELRVNVIQEDGLGKPVVEGGLWRIHPISTLRGMAK